MRRLLLSLAIASAGSLLIACGDSTSPTRDARTGVRGTTVAPPRDQVTGDLNAIYPSGGVGTAANAQLSNLFKSVDGGKMVAARQQAAALCEFTRKQQAAGRLHPPDVSVALSDAVNSLCDQLYLTVGLGPGGIDVSGQDAVAQFIPACQPAEVRLPNGRALVRWPAKDPTNTTCTYNQDVTVVITPIDYHGFAATKGPLTTAQNQWPYFYDITVVPLIQPNNPATVGICTLEVAPAGDEAYVAPETVHDNLRIGHNRSASAPGGVGFEILPSVFLSHADLDCIPENTGFNFGDDVRDRGLALALRDAAHFVARGAVAALTPTPAYAGHGGLGGLASSFSPFGAVETAPLSTAFTIKAIDPSSFTAVVYTSSLPYSASPRQLYILPAVTGDPSFTGTCVDGSWSSSNPSVATVSSTGVLTPVIGPNGTTRALGSTTISAICGGNTIQGPFDFYDPAIPSPIL